MLNGSTCIRSELSVAAKRRMQSDIRIYMKVACLPSCSWYYLPRLLTSASLTADRRWTLGMGKGYLLSKYLWYYHTYPPFQRLAKSTKAEVITNISTKMNSALREAANQARQKPVNLTHNQEVRSLSVGTGLPIPLQWVTRRNLCLMGDGARQCLMFFSFKWLWPVN